METLRENLSRARLISDAASMRATDAPGDGRTLYGHFSVFDTWYEVNSFWEGNFLERIAPGAFSRTIKERGGQVKALYDHGQDPQLGNKPLGPFRALSEDNVGGYYEIGLIETDYNNNFVIPAARAGLLGASFRFSVQAESWVDQPKASKDNPRALPERTISDVDLFELGPVTFPANGAADANLRSTTDGFLDKLLTDPLFVARFTERVGAGVVERALQSVPRERRRERLARALGADDAAALQALLTQLAAADAAFDPIVDAVMGADMALDAGQATLSQLLGQQNPDADAVMDDAGRSKPRGSDDVQRRVTGGRDRRTALSLVEALRLKP